MSKSTILMFVAALWLGGSLLGQGSGSTARDPGSARDSPFTVTKVAKGTIAEVADDEITVRVGEEEVSFEVSDATVVTAEKGADVPNAKEVTAADLKKGQRVDVKYRASDELALEVKILKSKS